MNRYSLASIFLGIGISAAFMIKGFSHSLLGLLLIVSGIVSFVWHYWDKYNWFRFLIQESDFDSENIITFSEENLKIQGKHSNGEINWSGIKDLVLAKYGLFLVLSKGISIYIPKGALSEDMLQVQELYKKAKLQSETD
ncbi:YcxB family protein [Leptospira sarikeiensis]|uniref:YcxB family protein n=1 Tax=Leptospira sarikeiensis TaxID=2484943 RepID=UPI001438312D|nr:YcxB family protein [Leptospira sarikeiensis]